MKGQRSSKLPERGMPREVRRRVPNPAGRLRESFTVEAFKEITRQTETSAWTEVSCSRFREKPDGSN